MTSFRHRELGATLRQCCLSGQPATVVIDHRSYEVSTKQISGEPYKRHRYGLCLYMGDAIRGISGSYQYATWEAANSERTGDMRIWDHSTTPPTDVTDADPDAKPDAESEMVNWAMAWQIEDGFHSWASPQWESFDVDVRELTTCTYRNGDLRYAKVSRRFPAGHTPTIHDLNEALKPYNVQVPVPEEPQWWMCCGYRNEGWDKWTTSEAVEPKGGIIWFGLGGLNQCRVWGTTADRDEKRDTLIEAALKAGKKP
jgi:hypothetical protein